MTILLRDSVIYYLIVFAVYLINLLIWSTRQAGLIETPVGFTIAMSCVMGNRLILNVRNLKREMEEGINGRGKNILPFSTNDSEVHRTTSVVVFAPRPRSMTLTSHSAFEFVELRGVHGPPQRPVV